MSNSPEVQLQEYMNAAERLRADRDRLAARLAEAEELMVLLWDAYSGDHNMGMEIDGRWIDQEEAARRVRLFLGENTE